MYPNHCYFMYKMLFNLSLYFFNILGNGRFSISDNVKHIQFDIWVSFKMIIKIIIRWSHIQCCDNNTLINLYESINIWDIVNYPYSINYSRDYISPGLSSKQALQSKQTGYQCTKSTSNLHNQSSTLAFISI